MQKTILLFEDQEQNRDEILRLLERHGHAVIPAADGELGMKLALRHHPHLILLDFHLSSMDAVVLVRALGRQPALASVPIMGMVPAPDLAERERALGAGCQGVLGKPLDPEAFMAGIERQLQSAGHLSRTAGFWWWAIRRAAKAKGTDLAQAAYS